MLCGTRVVAMKRECLFVTGCMEIMGRYMTPPIDTSGYERK